MKQENTNKEVFYENETERYHDNVRKCSYCKTFSQFEDQYTLDEKNKVLVKTGQKDLQAEIDSYADIALDKILDKYLPSEISQVQANNIAAVEFNGSTNEDISSLENDKLDIAMNSSNYFNAIREKYNLDPSISNKDIVLYLSKELDRVNNYLSKQNTKKGENLKDEKEIQVNETPKQENVQ